MPDESVNVGLYQQPGGQQSICVFVKRTYDLVDRRRMTRSQRAELPLCLEPISEDGEGTEPVECTVAECDLIPHKPCTDIIVHGHARSPDARPVTGMRASLRIGDDWKHVDVLGDRIVHWRPGSRPRFGLAEPFVAIPLTWRRAFGGIDPSVEVPPPSDDVLELLSALTPERHPGAYPRNPAGRGWVAHADVRRLHGLRLPNFEVPEHPVTEDRPVAGAVERWPWAPEPAGFGWVNQTWFPRSTLIGSGPEFASLPDHLRTGWLAVPPAVGEQIDPRFYCGASSGLRRFGLRGDELVELHGFHHQGPLTTALPGDAPRVAIALRRRPLQVARRLHTIELFADHDLASVLWVAEARAPRVLPLSFPRPDAASFELLEGVDVLIDGVAVASDLMG